MEAKGRLLVVEDDPAGRRLLATILAGAGYAVDAVGDGPSGLARAAADPPAAAVVDLRLPGMDGLEVLAKLKAADRALPVIILTGHAEVSTAVKAIRLGAFDYIAKPAGREEILLTVERALEDRGLREEVRRLRVEAGGGADLRRLMGPGPAAQRIAEQVVQVADSPLTVLVRGETGTGKELVAQAIHRQGPRHGRPFIAIDCGAIPESLIESELFGYERGAFTGAAGRQAGYFRLAQGGTLFLDEVGNLPLALQARLLRVLQERQVQPLGGGRPVSMDVRFVAATNRDLAAGVREGWFRQDLYFRLAEFTISLPPLRERPEDIPTLAARFLEEAAIEFRRPISAISSEALEALQRHTWPGNVRELRNALRQAVLRCSECVVLPHDLRLDGEGAAAPSSPAAPALPPTVPAPGETLRAIAARAAGAAEREAIIAALRAARGNKSEAARALRTDFKTLLRKIRRLGIPRGEPGA